MVKALDDAIGQLVRRCCGIQETRPQVPNQTFISCEEKVVQFPSSLSGSSPFQRSASTTELELTEWIPRADDLIPEESDTVLLALKRLPPKEAYDRVFRLRRAFQVC